MGSIALEVAIREGTVHRGPTQHLLFVLASYADPDGSGARVSMATLVERTGIAERTVQYALRRLVESGELRVNPGRGRGRLSEYAIDLALLLERMRVRRSAEKVQAATADAAEKVQNPHPVHPSAPEKVQGAPFVVGNGAADAPIGAEKVQAATADAAEKVQAPSGKGASAAPNRVRSDRVTGDDGTGLDRPAGRPGARAREIASAIVSSLEERLGIARDEGLLAELLEEFPELDAGALHGEIVAAATKRLRGKPWTLKDWRDWLTTGRQRREVRNGTHAHTGTADRGSAFAGIGRRSDQLGG